MDGQLAWTRHKDRRSSCKYDLWGSVYRQASRNPNSPAMRRLLQEAALDGQGWPRSRRRSAERRLKETASETCGVGRARTRPRNVSPRARLPVLTTHFTERRFGALVAGCRRDRVMQAGRDAHGWLFGSRRSTRRRWAQRVRPRRERGRCTGRGPASLVIRCAWSGSWTGARVPVGGRRRRGCPTGCRSPVLDRRRS